MLARLLARALHVIAHAGVAAEVERDVVLRLAAPDPQLARQAERAHAVHQAEVDGLGGAALVGGDLLQLAAEHFRRRRLVDVGAGFERAHQARVLRQVGHDAQFDLRVVAGHQLAARRRDEGLADAAPVVGADRDVLQVGIGRGQPPGRRTGLVIAGVHAAGVGIDHLRQLVGVGAAQLGQTAVFQDHPRQFVLVGDGFQRLLVGAGLAGGRLHKHRQLQFVEQQRLQLLGRIQVEGAAGQLGGLLLRRQHAL